MSKIMIPLVIIILVLFSSCTENITYPSDPFEDVEIIYTYIHHSYNADSTASQIFAQLSVSEDSPRYN